MHDIFLLDVVWRSQASDTDDKSYIGKTHSWALDIALTSIAICLSE